LAAAIIYRFRPALCLRRRPARPQGPHLDQRHSKSDGQMGCTSNHGGISLGWCSALHDPRPRSHLRHRRHTPIARHVHSRQAHCTSLTLAERLCRTADRIDPARVLGPHHCLRRGAPAPDSKIIRRLLQLRQNASVVAQGCAEFFVRLNRSESFVHTRSSAGFTIITSGFEFSIHTGGYEMCGSLKTHLPTYSCGIASDR
jgi:hypothetical protein